MPTLAALLLADAIEKDEEKPKPKPKPGEEEQQTGAQAPPPDPDISNPEQVAHDRHADSARDLKRRAREASYNALELDNSKASHAKAAKAHRAAAKASEKALGSATDPRAKNEFRSSQHSHNLHAAYHEKMSHSTEEERKASANKGKEENVGKAWTEAAREAAAAARSHGYKQTEHGHVGIGMHHASGRTLFIDHKGGWTSSVHGPRGDSGTGASALQSHLTAVHQSVSAPTQKVKKWKKHKAWTEAAREAAAEARSTHSKALHGEDQIKAAKGALRSQGFSIRHIQADRERGTQTNHYGHPDGHSAMLSRSGDSGSLRVHADSHTHDDINHHIDLHTSKREKRDTPKCEKCKQDKNKCKCGI